VAWSYGGVSFEGLRDGVHPGIPLFQRRQHIARFPIPGTDREVVQISGFGNPRLVVRIRVSGSTLAALQALADGTARTLSGVPTWGGGTTSYSNVVLLFEDEPQAAGYVGSDDTFVCRVTFEQVG
jgi:hypothetical protein